MQKCWRPERSTLEALFQALTLYQHSNEYYSSIAKPTVFDGIMCIIGDCDWLTETFFILKEITNEQPTT